MLTVRTTAYEQAEKSNASSVSIESVHDEILAAVQVKTLRLKLDFDRFGWIQFNRQSIHNR